MTKIFWLSFCDDDRPAGEQFLGVAIVQVDDADLAEVTAHYATHPQYARAPWLAAAMRKSHRLGINPGGSVLSSEIEPGALPDVFGRDRLLSRAELRDLGAYCVPATTGELP